MMPAFILVDTSGSMATPVVQAQMRPRIDLLRDTLAILLGTYADARVFAFSTEPRELEGIYQQDGLALPEPDGGTALHLALAYVGARRPMSRLVVISDGVADDPPAALAAARELAPLTIDAFHCGDDADRQAVAFMRKLSLAGGTGRGRYGVRDLSKPALLAAELRLLLTGPAR